MIILLLSNVIEKSCDYMISNVYVLYDDFMRFWYSCICAPYCICCMCSMWSGKWWHHRNYMCIYYTHSFAPQLHRVLIQICVGVAWQPHQKCGLSVGGSSPREVPNLTALLCDDRMSVLVLWDRSPWKCQM
jgi:hypothetical protein